MSRSVEKSILADSNIRKCIADILSTGNCFMHCYWNYGSPWSLLLDKLPSKDYGFFTEKQL